MNGYVLDRERVASYASWLRQEEHAPGTEEKYLRVVKAFAAWLGSQPVTREAVTGWKEALLARGYAPTTVNGSLAALNGLFRFLGWDDCRARYLRIQRRLFRDPNREMTRSDYDALTAAARSLGRERLALIMETICGTGIRVSEVRYITVEAVRQGRAEITMKGKIRIIMLPAKLCRRLLKYAQQQKIASGEIFLTRSGRPLTRCQIWAEMKALCRHAGVEPTRVFPHNLRHLFATVFYRTCRDLVKLADVLGHSSIETTRIYLQTSGAEHQSILDRLQLIL